MGKTKKGELLEWKKVLTNQTKEKELKFMVSEKECKLGTEEKFFKEEEIVAERKLLFN